jgi:hypothetical protein
VARSAVLGHAETLLAAMRHLITNESCASWARHWVSCIAEFAGRNRELADRLDGKPAQVIDRRDAAIHELSGVHM